MAVLAAAIPAAAHHSVAAEFDTSRQGTLEGEITEVWFTNPHVRYGLAVTNEDGSTENWELQTENIVYLRQRDLQEDSILVGDRVSVFGDFGRDGARKLNIHEIETSRGVQWRLNFESARADGNRINASPDRYYGHGPSGNDYPVDITGPWRNSYRFTPPRNDLEPKPVPFTDDGRRIYEATEPWHDYALRCLPPGLPRIFGGPYPVDIIDVGDHYLFLYLDHNTPRRIWMDGRTARQDTPATPMGFSIGRWEGEVLVVETTHLAPGWLDFSGLPMAGDGTRIVERYAPSDDRLSIERTMTISDPYYTEPLVRRRFSARDDDIDLNEVAPCDPDSFYRDLLTSGRLEEHFDR